MVDEDVLVAKLVEDAPRDLRRGATSVRGENGGSLQLGPMDASSAASSRRTRRGTPSRRMTSSVTSKFSARMLSTRAGIVGVDLQQRDRAVAELLQAAVDGLEQVVGLVLLDLEVGVANDAEQVRALHLRAREELLHVRVDDVFEEDEGLPVARRRDSPAAERTAAARPAA